MSAKGWTAFAQLQRNEGRFQLDIQVKKELARERTRHG
ncbi:hypothetical protein CES85_1773 [Ochrobactrum quorumnocens]|uniref:Uncharacterized protein n=1 Tax=Ochrobactrum quorumnocens TaxID=271865 RepID=A0A248UFX5_9HYPH|nr:hypothetical protein CES85_1773 [[Ochrobactrum] quorumnocens]